VEGVRPEDEGWGYPEVRAFRNGRCHSFHRALYALYLWAHPPPRAPTFLVLFLSLDTPSSAPPVPARYPAAASAVHRRPMHKRASACVHGLVPTCICVQSILPPPLITFCPFPPSPATAATMTPLSSRLPLTPSRARASWLHSSTRRPTSSSSASRKPTSCYTPPSPSNSTATPPIRVCAR